MPIIVIKLLLLLFFVLTYQSLIVFNYTYVNFALIWLGTFCQKNKCIQQSINSWDRSSFKVHGLWPSSDDNGYQTTFQNGDKTCKLNEDYDLKLLPQNIIRKLNQVMPGVSQQKNGFNFLQYEFNKHGACYVNLVKQSGSKLSSQQLIICYFEAIIKLYESITSKFDLHKNQYKGTQDFGKAIKLDSKTFHITTIENKILSLNICLSPPFNNPGSQKIIQCSENIPQNQIKKINNMSTNYQQLILPGLKTMKRKHLYHK